MFFVVVVGIAAVIAVVVVLMLLRLTHQLIVDFDTLRWRIAHPFYLPIIMLHFDLLQPLIRDFSNHICIATCGLVGHGARISRLTAYNLGWCFG